jgi:hypothetical protein
MSVHAQWQHYEYDECVAILEADRESVRQSLNA